jgi:hypothetical protein
MRALALVLLVAFSGQAPATNALAQFESAARHTGRIHSLLPAEGVLVIEAVGPGGQTTLLEVGIRQAQVVRVRRDPGDPWRFQERPTRVHRWPAGTFLVIEGWSAGPGVIAAERIEIVELD